jgi:hypothetical protein
MARDGQEFSFGQPIRTSTCDAKPTQNAGDDRMQPNSNENLARDHRRQVIAFKVQLHESEDEAVIGEKVKQRQRG